MELKDRIRRAREAAGLTQAQLGERVGRSAKTVRNWEAGTSPKGSIGALERVLGVNLSDDRTRDPIRDALEQATDAQLLQTLADRLADRSRAVAQVNEELARHGDAEVAHLHDRGPDSPRWAARIRE